MPAVGRPMHGRHSDERHRQGAGGALRAAVLGANDGLVSTASLVVAIASGGATDRAVLLAGIAGVVAGALSMAVGEYMSVASERDRQRAELAIERDELRRFPDAELEELAAIYRRRGLTPALARTVAEELTAHDALGAHARDELGITEVARARPVQAALSSAAAFSLGGLVPALAHGIAPARETAVVVAATVAGLAVLGWWSAAVGQAPRVRASARVVAGGSLAMALSALAGEVAGTVVG